MACFEKCRSLTFVVPCPSLFPKLCGVEIYRENARLLFEYLTERGVYCVEAKELVGKVGTYDGEHFCNGSDKIIAESVLQWVANARPLQSVDGRESIQEVPSKVVKL